MKRVARWLCVCLAAWASGTAAAVLEVTVVDGAGAPLAHAVVYARAARAVAAAPAPTPAIVQRQKAFHPFVSVIQAGTAVAFPNEDTVRHHVYSFSPAKVFELKLYIGTPREPVLFDKTGVVVLGCNIHDQMLAYVVVVETPFFAKTDAAGRAVLELPEQQYAVAAWHPSMPNATVLPQPFAEVRVPAQRAVRAVLQVSGAAPAHRSPH